MNGIDYSGWRPPSPEWLLQQGFGFVCRYLKVLPNAYAIDAAEFASLRAAGVQVVLNWEQDINDWTTNGLAYAQAALAQAQALGAWPCPIYFSVDTGSPDMAAVNSYFAGIASVIGAENTGIYGGFAVVSNVDKRYVCWFWQTYAWSAGQWADVHIRQVPGGSSNYDLDQAMVDNFGQVGYVKPKPDPHIAKEKVTLRSIRPANFPVGPGSIDDYDVDSSGKLWHAVYSNGPDEPAEYNEALQGEWEDVLECGYDVGKGQVWVKGRGTDGHLYSLIWWETQGAGSWQGPYEEVA